MTFMLKTEPNRTVNTSNGYCSTNLYRRIKSESKHLSSLLDCIWVSDLMEGSYLICYALYNNGYLMVALTLIYIVEVNLNSI